MQPELKIRGHVALRWMLGVGLVFLGAIGMALQEAQRRANERWQSVLTYLDEELVSIYRMPVVNPVTLEPVIRDVALFMSESEARGGNIFREWRQVQRSGSGVLVLRQERNLFGSYIEARAYWNWCKLDPLPDLDTAIHDILSEVDVELGFVEPSVVGRCIGIE